MKNNVTGLIIGVALAGMADYGAAARLSGNLYTEFYSYQTKIPEANSYLRSYQGYRVNVSDAFVPGLTVFASGRVASDISTKLPTDPDYRGFSAYMQYQPKSGKYALRAGRQFVYEGLDGFILDGGKLRAKIGKRLSATVYAGSMPGPSFFIYNQVNKWDRRNAVGGRVNVKTGESYSFNFSYLQKSKDDLLDSRLIGFDHLFSRGKYTNRLRVDYDILFERLKYLSLSPRIRYSRGHTLRAEYAYRKPSFGRNDFLSVIESNSINQARLSGTYKLDENVHGIGGVSYTKFSDASSISLRVGANNKAHNGGIVYSSGYGGSKIGLFGGLRFGLTADFTVYGNIDMYNYKLDTDEDESESTVAAALGGWYRISGSFSARAELQALTNPRYDYDTRGYLRVDYSISKEIRGLGQEGGEGR